VGEEVSVDFVLRMTFGNSGDGKVWRNVAHKLENAVRKMISIIVGEFLLKVKKAEVLQKFFITSSQ